MTKAKSATATTPIKRGRPKKKVFEKGQLWMTGDGTIWEITSIEEGFSSSYPVNAKRTTGAYYTEEFTKEGHLYKDEPNKAHDLITLVAREVKQDEVIDTTVPEFKIDRPGKFLTRDGDVATVVRVNPYAQDGQYVIGFCGEADVDNGLETWGLAGNYLENRENPSDIVSRLEDPVKLYINVYHENGDDHASFEAHATKALAKEERDDGHSWRGDVIAYVETEVHYQIGQGLEK